jgi:hypothetical protein
MEETAASVVPEGAEKDLRSSPVFDDEEEGADGKCGMQVALMFHSPPEPVQEKRQHEHMAWVFLEEESVLQGELPPLAAVTFLLRTGGAGSDGRKCSALAS